MADSEQAVSASTTGGFEARWFATDLGAYRPCDFTYQAYAYDSVPPLDPARYTGAFDWAGGGGAGEPLPELVAELTALAEDVSAHGLTLPPEFTAFQTGSHTSRLLDAVSVTACWTSLSRPLPSPVEPGAFLVRFLRDQQDCLHWYLYLRPTGEAFVVVSPVDHEADADAIPLEIRQQSIVWCAPSFEEFAHRFWIENCLWHEINGGGDASRLEPQLRSYLDHYARQPAGA
ncbi:hypothetical protein AB0953_30315 [Streptomyces sp. NPDC046866]|uniref:hypothetical protein n=1 Tax=Streptomyces sp. NPDC046866 TaxID=3154921 RepID=UPI0034535A3D